jgi:hypothetical protein
LKKLFDDQDVSVTQNSILLEDSIYIDEAIPGDTENAESVMRDLLVSKMKLASDLVSAMKSERIHRMGEKRRPIIAKFNLFKERELVKGLVVHLKVHHTLFMSIQQT